ncbi:MAG: GntR family transcriptional regulator [Anaerolineales bacterium]|nr:GntR family transcriptional regulator [Anaerolineales bacterium]
MQDDEKFDPVLVENLRSSPRVSDMVYRALRKSILSGKIKPGEWLKEKVLASELGVSRTSVRAGLRHLIADGLAVQEPYKGVRIVSIPVEEMQQVLSLRAILEGMAHEIAAEKLSPEELRRMRELLPLTLEPSTLDGEKLEETRQANREFHWIAIRASGQRHLIHLLEYLWNLAPTDMLVSILSEEDMLSLQEADLKAHTELLKALEAGDGRRAREINELHVKPAIQRIQGVIERETLKEGK